MAERSAGILLYRRVHGILEVLLVHPGGPYWKNKDAGAWQIPKGLVEREEAALDTARREAAEELGIALAGTPVFLTTIRQAGGKRVEVFALEEDVDCDAIRSNSFDLEWPPGSSRIESFPEIDAARWFTLDDAAVVMLRSQQPILSSLESHLTG